MVQLTDTKHAVLLLVCFVALAASLHLILPLLDSLQVEGEGGGPLGNVEDDGNPRVKAQGGYGVDPTPPPFSSVALPSVLRFTWGKQSAQPQDLQRPSSTGAVTNTPRPRTMTVAFATPSPTEAKPQYSAAPIAGRTLAYCGTFGAFTNRVITLFKAMWLASKLDRRLVLPDLIRGMRVSELFEMSFIHDYLNRSGGFLTVEQVGCLPVDAVWATSQGLASLRGANKTGPRSCLDPHEDDQRSKCSFSGASEVKEFTINLRGEVSLPHHHNGSLPQRMTMMAGMMFSLPLSWKDLPVVPFHPAIVGNAQAILDQLPLLSNSELGSADANSPGAPLSMCAHFRRGDLAHAQPSIAKVVEQVIRMMEALASPHRVAKLLIVHNANATEEAYLRTHLPQGTQISCDGAKWPVCERWSTMQIVMEQAICSMTDIFMGSPSSSFSAFISELRVRVNGKPERSVAYFSLDENPIYTPVVVVSPGPSSSPPKAPKKKKTFLL